MRNFYHLENTVQNYAWGSVRQLCDVLGIINESKQPMAEIWMGAHDKAPSRIVDDSISMTLTEFIAKDPTGILGEEAAKIYNGKLPFLFKILSADYPLSIQAHPDKAAAMDGHQRENELKLSINAVERNYKDSNHKPELVCALTDFKALNGFRPINEIVDYFERVENPAILEESKRLKNENSAAGLRRFYQILMNLSLSQQSELIGQFREQRDFYDNKAYQEFQCLLQCVTDDDIGVLSPFLLNLINLKPGEAMYLTAGELHAYLYGTCIEIMANSDNVIRGGLTQKHIDIEELVKILTFKTGHPKVLRPQWGAVPQIKEYFSDTSEFKLTVIDSAKQLQHIDIRMNSIEILICTEGQMRLESTDQSESLVLNRSESCVIPALTQQYTIEGKGVIYRASVRGF